MGTSLLAIFDEVGEMLTADFLLPCLHKHRDHTLPEFHPWSHRMNEPELHLWASLNAHEHAHTINNATLLRLTTRGVGSRKRVKKTEYMTL